MLSNTLRVKKKSTYEINLHTRREVQNEETEKIKLLKGMVWYGMEAFLYTEGIQLTAAHSGGND